MAKDKLFHKKRERKTESLERATEWRDSNKTVLIVCEGKETEPNYLHGLRRELRISKAACNILDTDSGTDPVSVLNAAIAEFSKDESLYDRVYCVFDRDGHANYADALNLAKNHPLTKRKILFIANSVPCFEIWLLLHFKYSTQVYVKAGNKSPCDCVASDLKLPGRIPNYTKNHKGVYELLSAKTDTALRHAKALERHNRAIGTDNPSTRMHELVAYLTSIAP